VDVRDPHPARALQSPHIPTYAVASASLASAALTVTPGRLDDAGGAGGGTRISGDIWRAGCRHLKSRCGGVLDDPVSSARPSRGETLPQNSKKENTQAAGINSSREGQDQERTQHSATPNSLFRSVGVLHASVVNPEYSVFSRTHH
jgi:hypothetical protein